MLRTCWGGNPALSPMLPPGRLVRAADLGGRLRNLKYVDHDRAVTYLQREVVADEDADPDPAHVEPVQKGVGLHALCDNPQQEERARRGGGGGMRELF